MKTVNDYHPKNSQPQSAVTEYQREELERVNRAIQDCKEKGTSTYITVKGNTYLVTPHGLMSYEGTATVAYSQSRP